MDKRTLSVVKREHIGKNALKAVRAQGFIPAIVYGHSENIVLSVNSREFNKKFKTITENTIIDLKDGKNVYHVLIKDFHEDHTKGEILHIDFYEVEKGKTLHTTVPVHLEGNAKGVKEGGQLEHILHEVQVECLPKDIPSQIVVNIDDLGLGQSIHLSEVKAIDNVKFISSPEQVVVHVIKHGPQVVESAE